MYHYTDYNGQEQMMCEMEATSIPTPGYETAKQRREAMEAGGGAPEPPPLKPLERSNNYPTTREKQWKEGGLVKRYTWTREQMEALREFRKGGHGASKPGYASHGRFADQAHAQ